MSFNRMLYFAANVVGAVAIATMFSGASAIIAGAVLIFVIALGSWMNENQGSDPGREAVLFIIFAIGLVAEIFAWNWVLPLIILMYFGTVFVNWAFTAR